MAQTTPAEVTAVGTGIPPASTSSVHARRWDFAFGDHRMEEFLPLGILEGLGSERLPLLLFPQSNIWDAVAG